MSGDRRIIRTGAVALTAAVTLAACGSSGNTAAHGNGSGEVSTNGTITIGTTLAPTTLDPATGSSGTDYQYLYFLFDRLIQSNPHTGALEPMLATSWKFSPNKLSLTVRLRHGVKFQDGTPLDAQAVVRYSEEYIKDGDVVNDLQYVTSVTADGQYQVVYHLSQQNAQLPTGLADRAGMIVSPTAVAKEGKGFGTHPVGAGPYRFTSENPGSAYSFTRFDGYWNNTARPRVEHITFQEFSNDTSLVSAMRSGVIQVAAGIFPQDVATLKTDPNVQVAIGPSTGFDMAFFNASLKPLTDPRVRLAFNLALNRGAIMSAATDGLGRVANEPSAKGTAGYVPSLDPLWTYDPAKAKQILAQAGYAKGVNMSCYTYPGLGYDITVPILIAEEKAVGINIHVISGTPVQVVPWYTKNLSPCYLSAWSGGTNPLSFYQVVLWGKSYYNAGKTDFGADQYINQFLTTYSTGGFQQLFTKILQAQKTDPGYAPIYGTPVINVYQKNIRGWISSPFFALENWQGMFFTS